MPIYTRVTGQTEYSLPVFTANAPRLNAEFGRVAGENIRRDPMIYVSNVTNNLWRFPLDASGWWWRRCPGQPGRPLEWTKPAPPTPRARRAASRPAPGRWPRAWSGSPGSS